MFGVVPVVAETHECDGVGSVYSFSAPFSPLGVSGIESEYVMIHFCPSWHWPSFLFPPILDTPLFPSSPLGVSE